MGSEENKAVVRQCLTGMHAAPPDLNVFDELLAPNYQGDLAGQKAFASTLHAAIGEQTFDFQDMVAKGDAVVVRFNDSVTLLDGSIATAHPFMNCRLEDGKLVAQDVMTNPDVGPVFAPLFALPPK